MTIVDRFLFGGGAMGVVGHRGSRATHPENTIAAFRHAIECRADAVELDVVMTRDGRLAVTHDPVAGNFADLPEGVPELSEVLALAPGNELIFDIEMKECGHDYTQQLVAALDRPELAGRVMVRSFHHPFLRALAELRPNIPLAALVGVSIRDWVAICRAAKARCISPRYEGVTAKRVERAHAEGLAVIPWTVNGPRQWQRLAKLKVDAVITDDPAALIQFLRARSS